MVALHPQTRALPQHLLRFPHHSRAGPNKAATALKTIFEGLTDMTEIRPARVVVAGGHSAGHIEPAMNFADALRRLEPTAEIPALGTVRGLDTRPLAAP